MFLHLLLQDCRHGATGSKWGHASTHQGLQPLVTGVRSLLALEGGYSTSCLVATQPKSQLKRQYVVVAA